MFNKYKYRGAYHYGWYETEDWYKWMVDRCVDFCEGSTIDVGCGDGVVANMIANQYSAVGVDKDEIAIELAKKNGRATFICSDIDHVAFDQTEYLTCVNVIEHLDRPEVLKEIIRDITKGAIITTIDWQGGAFGEDHRFEFTMDQLMDFFKEFKPKPFRYKDTEWIGVEIKK